MPPTGQQHSRRQHDGLGQDLQGARQSTSRGFWSRFCRQPAGLLGTALLMLLVVLALSAKQIALYDPFATSNDVLQPPSATHPLGTDDLGRDLFSAVVHGARVSLLVGLVSAFTATVIGVVVGGLAGYSGGFVDDALMRVTELFQIIPRFFLALIVVALLGSSIWLIVVLLGLTYWPGTARLLRAQVLTLRTREYVLAARAVGVPEARILLRHVLPGALPVVCTQAALHVGGAILIEAGLSFLGLGDRNVVSWGALLNDAQQFVRAAWWMSAFPGLAITLTVLGSNLLADGLNEAWDARLAGR
ncbi:MAG: ABC transporter permease [Chloroflexota bacterium]|nr:ABC transporter permease [Chloroflexota bacterium]